MIARYIIQHCDLGEHKVHKYLSIGGPHQGLVSEPLCTSSFSCFWLNAVHQMSYIVPFLKDVYAPSGYFRDPKISTDIYKSKNNYNYYSSLVSDFLAKLNNEKLHSQNAMYRKRFASLDDVMFVSFEKDTVYHPPQTALFQEISKEGYVLGFDQTPSFIND